MNRATVNRPGKLPVQVKNLGWMLRHWREIERVAFLYTGGPLPAPDGVLVAHLRGGGTYQTAFASWSVCVLFLDRPVLRGLPFDFVGLDGVALWSDGIGSATWPGRGAR